MWPFGPDPERNSSMLLRLRRLPEAAKTVFKNPACGRPRAKNSWVAWVSLFLFNENKNNDFLFAIWAVSDSKVAGQCCATAAWLKSRNRDQPMAIKSKKPPEATSQEFAHLVAHVKYVPIHSGSLDPEILHHGHVEEGCMQPKTKARRLKWRGGLWRRAGLK